MRPACVRRPSPERSRRAGDTESGTAPSRTTSRTPSERTAQTTTPSASPMRSAPRKHRAEHPEQRRAARSRSPGRATSRRVQGAVPAPWWLASPQSQLWAGAARKLRSSGEKVSTYAGVRLASGCASSTRRYGRAMRPAAIAKDADTDDGRRPRLADRCGTARRASASTAIAPSTSEEIRELETQREAERHLPRRDEPAAQTSQRRSPSVAAEEQEQRKRDAPAREHVEMAVLRELPRRVGERGPGRDGTDPTDPELPCKQVRADEGERRRRPRKRRL